MEETVFCLSAAVLARPWPVAGANQMFDVRVLCFLMSHSGQQGVVAEGSSAWSLQFVSASGDTLHTAHCHGGHTDLIMLRRVSGYRD